MSKWENNEEIEIFREYLRIPSVHPDIDYTPCVDFLKRQAKSLDLGVTIYTPGGPTQPIVVLEWTGTQPELPRIVLNSHMDVVPVFPEEWTYPPFSAHLDEDGKIFARGSQDMKCVGMQYLAAIREMKREGVQLKRTLLVVFVPDEEVGGKLGMQLFVKSEEFKNMNIGFSMDEGIAGPTEEFMLYYGERAIWHMRFTCSGTPGHGSLLLKNTAGEKASYVINKFFEFRKNEVLKLENNHEFSIGDVTTVNLTVMRGGVQDNVIPPELSFIFDIRIAVNILHEELEAKIRGWCEEAGGGIRIDFDQKDPFIQPTNLENNKFWDAYKSAIDELGIDVKPRIFPGGTDSRYIRQAGIPAIGFSPMNNTPVLLHDHNEYLDADVYLKGIGILRKIIQKVASV